MNPGPPLRALLLSIGLFLTVPSGANEWPGWRGPDGDGKLPLDARYPVDWSASKNLLWTANLASPGNSSPIVWGDRIFLTMAEDGGRLRSLLCFDANSGEQLWKKTISYGKDDPTHKTNPFCAASPVTDGKTVFTWQGNAGLRAYDFDGRELWNCDLGSDYAHQWGANAASPVFFGDAIIIHAGPGPATRLASVGRSSGKILWKRELPEATSAVKDFKGSWATPLLIENDDRAELLVGLPGWFTSMDPITGEELWRIAGLGDLCYTNVLAGDGTAVYLSGYGGPGVGIRLPGAAETGDLTESHRLWADPPKGKNKNQQRIGSGQIVGDHIYLLNEPGMMQCIEVASGKSIWKERIGRKSWSSMNFVGGKLYVNDTSATTFVIEPNPAALQVVATNSVGGKHHTNASLAFANGRIYLRTDSSLIAIGE
jgi:outer membrane protein assembly factor BamB